MLPSVFPKATQFIWITLKSSYLLKSSRRVKWIHQSVFLCIIKFWTRVYVVSQSLKTIIDFKNLMSWKSLVGPRAVKTSQRAEFSKLWENSRSRCRGNDLRYTTLVFQETEWIARVSQACDWASRVAVIKHGVNSETRPYYKRSWQ